MTQSPPSRQAVAFRGAGGVRLTADEWSAASSAGRAAGSATGSPTVLLLHGGGQNRHSWRSTGDILAGLGHRVIALDTRGHGDSDRSPGADYSLDTLAADVAEVIEAVGPPVALVGASMGGLTGILAAEAAGPGRVTRLVLVDVVPRFERAGSNRISDFMFSGVDGFDSLEEAADAVAAYLPHRDRARNPEGLKKNLRRRDGRWYWHWDPALLTRPGDDPLLHSDALEAAAARLRIPILLIRGRLSDVVSAEGVRDFRAKVPGIEFVELDHAGHTAAGDDNDAFSTTVARFIARP